MRVVVGFVVVELVLLAAIVAEATGRVLPAGLATQVGHNSEALLLAAVLTAAIAWVRRGARSGHVAVVVVLLLAAAVASLGLENPRLRTLNEPLLAAGLLVPYVALRPRRPAYALLVVPLAAAMLVFSGTDVVRLQAECLWALLLVPVGVDLVAPWLLDPARRVRVAPALAWTAALFLVPWLMRPLKGTVLPLVEYAARGNEAFWGLCLVHAVGLLAWASLRLPKIGETPAATAPTS